MSTNEIAIYRKDRNYAKYKPLVRGTVAECEAWLTAHTGWVARSTGGDYEAIVLRRRVLLDGGKISHEDLLVAEDQVVSSGSGERQYLAPVKLSWSDDRNRLIEIHNPTQEQIDAAQK